MSADGNQSGGPSRPQPDLNALLGSRICHDLISPLGAIGNGVELLSMSGVNAAPEIALISESVENASARIRLFRIAFGAASASQVVPEGEIRQILAGFSGGGRLRINWTPGQDLPRPRIKLAFLLLQCLETSMPYGGQIQISEGEDDWRMDATADRLKTDPALWDLVVNPRAEVDVSPAHVHFALVAEAAQQAGRLLHTELQETRIVITF